MTSISHHHGLLGPQPRHSENVGYKLALVRPRSIQFAAEDPSKIARQTEALEDALRVDEWFGCGNVQLSISGGELLQSTWNAVVDNVLEYPYCLESFPIGRNSLINTLVIVYCGKELTERVPQRWSDEPGEIRVGWHRLMQFLQSMLNASNDSLRRVRQRAIEVQKNVQGRLLVA